MKGFFIKNILKFALLQAFIATIGSLYFSEVLKLPPCNLCWYQRIFMYPLVIIIAVAIFKKFKDVHLFVLPLSLLGLSVAVYHNLLYYRLIPESIVPCTTGVSCTTKLIEIFGFITIPLLSLIAFSIISLLLLIYWRINRD